MCNIFTISTFEIYRRVCSSPTCDVTLSTVVVGNQTAEIYLWALVEPTKQLGYKFNQISETSKTIKYL